MAEPLLPTPDAPGSDEAGPAGDRRTRVHLITGLPGAGKTTLLRGWLADRPPGERWAVLVEGLTDPGPIDAAANGGPDPEKPELPAVVVRGLLGGCACCIGGPAFGVAVGQLLRQGRWDRLFIEVSAQADGSALVDRLRSPPLAAHLRVEPVVLVINAQSALPYLDPGRSGHPPAQARLALARLVALNRAASLPQAELALERLRQAPPWPRRVVPAPHGTLDLSWLQSPDDVPDSPGPHGGVELHWSERICFDRLRLRAWLQAGLADQTRALGARLLSVNGVFRTPRAWYAWHPGPGDDAQGGQGAWQETAWRHDNRVAVLADPPLDPIWLAQRLRSAIASEDAGGG